MVGFIVFALIFGTIIVKFLSAPGWFIAGVILVIWAIGANASR